MNSYSGSKVCRNIDHNQRLFEIKVTYFYEEGMKWTRKLLALFSISTKFFLDSLASTPHLHKRLKQLFNIFGFHMTLKINCYPLLFYVIQTNLNRLTLILSALKISKGLHFILSIDSYSIELVYYYLNIRNATVKKNC